MVKRTLAGALLGLVLAQAGCGREDPAVEQAPAAATAPAAAPVAATVAVASAAPAAASRKLLDDYLAAWNAHDENAVGALFTDDVEFFDAGFSGIQRGRDAAMEHGVGVFMRGVPDLRWELRGEPVVGAGAVAWEWTFTGTHTGTWGGIPATRQGIVLKGVSVLRIRDGRIAQVSSYYDSGSLNRQLGL
jgi:steroid delta-isomerase-like uncharacterized protein